MEPTVHIYLLRKMLFFLLFLLVGKMLVYISSMMSKDVILLVTAGNYLSIYVHMFMAITCTSIYLPISQSI